MKQDPADIILTASNVGHTASRGMDGWEMELKVEFLKLLINFFSILTEYWVTKKHWHTQSHNIPKKMEVTFKTEIVYYI